MRRHVTPYFVFSSVQASIPWNNELGLWINGFPDRNIHFFIEFCFCFGCYCFFIEFCRPRFLLKEILCRHQERIESPLSLHWLSLSLFWNGNLLAMFYRLLPFRPLLLLPLVLRSAHFFSLLENGMGLIEPKRGLHKQKETVWPPYLFPILLINHSRFFLTDWSSFHGNLHFNLSFLSFLFLDRRLWLFCLTRLAGRTEVLILVVRQLSQ